MTLNPRDPGSSGNGDGGSDSGRGQRREEKQKCFLGQLEISCKGEGIWSNARQCWTQRVVPAPPIGDPRWENHTEGSVWSCRPVGAGEGGTIGGNFGGGTYWFWMPPGESSDAVDPVDLAEEAIERMHLVSPTVGMTPLNPEAPMVVGVPAWLWVGDAPNAFGPITRTATAGSTTVTATAQVTHVTWEMGDGTTVTCDSPGTPWTPRKGTGASPTCGHIYERPSIDEPDRKFEVAATTHWQVDWTGAGQRGEITFTLTGTRQLEVTEIQVLQTR